MIDVVVRRQDMLDQVEEPHNAKHAPRWGFFGPNPDSKPELRCDCGEWLKLSDFHISVDGHLTPSFLHETCGWHVMVQLAEWAGAEFKKGEV